MRESTIVVQLDYPIEDIWNIIIDNENTKWRSDIKKVEIKNENEFVEYYPNGNSTTFYITTKEPYRYEFEMKNKMFEGHWIGTLEKKQKKTEMTLKEQLNIKNPVIKILSYILFNIKKIQNQYIEDLKKELKRRENETV